MIDNKKLLDETDEAIVSERDGMYVLDLYYRVAPLYDYEILQSGFGGFDFQAQKYGDSYFSTAAGKVTLPIRTIRIRSRTGRRSRGTTSRSSCSRTERRLEPRSSIIH